MYCDVVFMFVMLLVLVLVTSTWYTTTHWLSRDQVRLTDDSVSVVPSISVTYTYLGGGGIARVHKKEWFLMRTDSVDNCTQLLYTYMSMLCTCTNLSAGPKCGAELLHQMNHDT